MFLSNPFPGAFGLDINDLSITLVQLSKHTSFFKPASYKIAESRSVSLPPGCIVNGEIAQPEVVRRKILHLLGDDKTYKPIHTPWVVANLPEPKTFVTRIHIDSAAKDILPDDITYHAAQHLPFALDEAYIDWQVISSNEHSTEILLSAAAKTTANAYTYLLEAAGLNPLALEPEAQAIARVMITEGKDYTGEARALLDIGETRSSLFIYDKNSIQFTANVRFSLQSLATATAQALKLPPDEAAKLVSDHGIQYTKKQPKYIAVLDEQLTTLIADVEQSFAFYRDHFIDSNPITHITMCGAAADLPNVATVLAEKLKVTADPGKVWKNIMPSTKQKPNDLALTTALGLALRAIKNPLQSHR